ncbi:MAG TPA: selenocysteine-specific translation elongation factor [Candidatus Sulfotelmatobacter sp.]|nr:selenocysteine-specific translation elongation factor [Candidatus Sulfotelmatobacter sp.]
MKSIIVGTAGHIDHGKTALVKALTGIDADRLEEEKRRGITIDLGFAHMDLPGAAGETLRLGFVDVPGHERFVRNMLAGVGGIDLVLLVIAADESIKPQTREHFDILRLIGVKRGIIVLTKSDTVDAETLDVVRLEVEEFLRGTFLESPKSPVVAVSALTGEGLGDLKQAMVAAAAEVEARDSQALARLPIDRVFTMKGFGTVVTGTLISGTIRKEDELEVFPTGLRVRVRGVQVHGSAADAAVAGQRTALNLAGVSTKDLSRGMTLAPVVTFAATRRADVKVQMLASAPRPLKNRTRVHFHSNTMEVVADLRLYGQGELVPGESGSARAMLPAPALLLPGDRFILRQFSPVVTIGGGVVLDSAPMLTPRQAAAFPGFGQMMEVLESEQRGAILALRVTRRGKRGLSLAEAVAETGWHPREVGELAAGLTDNLLVMRVQDRLFAEYELKLAQESMLDAVAASHKKDPLRPGMAKSELQDEMSLALEMAGEVFGAALSSLIRERRLEVAGDLVRVPGRGTEMKDEEAEAKKKIEDAFASAGLKVPALAEVLAGLKLDKARAQKIVTLLLRDKVLVKVSQELVFHRTALEELRRHLADYKTKSPRIDVTKFKELTGVSRKYAIPLLEYLDRERVTRRVGDVREIL